MSATAPAPRTESRTVVPPSPQVQFETAVDSLCEAVAGKPVKSRDISTLTASMRAQADAIDERAAAVVAFPASLSIRIDGRDYNPMNVAAYVCGLRYDGKIRSQFVNAGAKRAAARSAE